MHCCATWKRKRTENRKRAPAGISRAPKQSSIEILCPDIITERENEEMKQNIFESITRLEKAAVSMNCRADEMTAHDLKKIYDSLKDDSGNMDPGKVLNAIQSLYKAGYVAGYSRATAGKSSGLYYETSGTLPAGE